MLNLDQDEPDGLSARINAIADRYAYLLSLITPPAFSRAEWLLMADACSGWASAQEPAETLVGAVAAEVEDSLPDGLSGKWGLTDVQARALCRRLKALSPAENIWLVEKIERFRRHSGLSHDEAMQAAGIVPEA